MKEECQIVRDLLLGYKDNTLNEASKKMVEKHLETCQSCLEVFKVIKEENEECIETEVIDGFKKVDNKIKKKNIIIKIISAILAVFVLYSIIAIINYNTVSNMEVFLDDSITEEEIESIKMKILEIDEKSKIEYYSKDDQIEALKDKLGENSNLLDGYEGEKNIFPASFIIKASRNKIDEIKLKLITIEKIEHITINSVDPYSLLFTQIYMKIFK